MCVRVESVQFLSNKSEITVIDSFSKWILVFLSLYHHQYDIRLGSTQQFPCILIQMNWRENKKSKHFLCNRDRSRWKMNHTRFSVRFTKKHEHTNFGFGCMRAHATSDEKQRERNSAIHTLQFSWKQSSKNKTTCSSSNKRIKTVWLNAPRSYESQYSFDFTLRLVSIFCFIFSFRILHGKLFIEYSVVAMVVMPE